MYGTSSSDPDDEVPPPQPAIGPSSRGLWLMGNDVDLARRLAPTGFDWIALDAQHGAIDRSALVDLGRALGDVGTNFVVRVPGVDHSWIGASLDAGAAGVVVPTPAARAATEPVAPTPAVGVVAGPAGEVIDALGWRSFGTLETPRRRAIDAPPTAFRSPIPGAVEGGAVVDRNRQARAGLERLERAQHAHAEIDVVGSGIAPVLQEPVVRVAPRQCALLGV